ncbi:MAG: bifunctional phosphoribosylaminoimidazolecarboxamide formyltransferase/IMP cyclohydrolase, partial [Elusimicrobia bacterium]|nr:bifunctional phosphoribosylaminoimidazolecarboxamide formyltransferase/IMP cyclohydrolase [Elusimicrobiota bacterium]
PSTFSLSFNKAEDLRYGENPHQAAAFYKEAGSSPSGMAAIQKLHGKELSFNNILDLYAAVDIAYGFTTPAVALIKHNNPSGVATDKDLAKAYKAAWQCDSLSAFGGIIGLNRPVDAKTAALIQKSGFMECVIAPAFDKGALEILTQKKNLRLVTLDPRLFVKDRYDVKKVPGGMLLQETDLKEISFSDLKVVTKKRPTKAQIASMLFGWKVVKAVKSNAVLLTKGEKTVGIGMGLTSRVDSAILAIRKAGKLSQGACLASDAFLPKPDTVILAAKAGVSAIIQTGGSISDGEVIKEADKRGLVMVFTGARHFRH